LEITRKQRILLVERLDLLSLPVWGLLAWWYGGGYFVGWARTLKPTWLRCFVARLTGLRQVRYEEFPGTYFEVQRIVADSANDTFYDGARASGAAPIVTFLRRFRNHEFMEVALRKSLQANYTEGRIKALVLLREIVRLHDEIVFVTRDNRDPRSWVPASLVKAWNYATVPRIVRLCNTIKAWFEPLAVVGYTALIVGYLVVRRGLVLTTPTQRHWRVGYDLFDVGIHWDRPYDEFFLYDNRNLSPQAILHVVRDRIRDKRSRRYLEENGIAYVEDGRVAIPLGYLFRRILQQFWVGTVCLALGRRPDKDGAVFLWAAVMVLLELIKEEVLQTAYTLDVFLGRDEYRVRHIVRTLIFDERGGKTIGFSHGDETIAQPSNSYQCFHVFCFPGPFHEKILEWNTRYSLNTCIIGAGLYGLDETHRRIQAGTIPVKYKELQRRYRIVGAFASSFKEDFFITREMTLRFYRTVLRIPQLYPDVVLVLRPKGSEFGDPEFRGLLVDTGPRVILEEKMWTYDLIPAVDLMICIAVSSVGLEGLMAGRRVIYFDESNLDDHPYEKYDPMLVAHSPESLLATVGSVVERDQYIATCVVDQIRQYHGFQFDGKVVQRLREVIYTAMGETAAAAKPNDSPSLLPVDTWRSITKFTEQVS
jgi:hypothetical protein